MTSRWLMSSLNDIVTTIMLTTKFSSISSDSMKDRLRIRLRQNVSLMQSQLHESTMKSRLIETISFARYWWWYLHFQIEFLRLRCFIRARDDDATAAEDQDRIDTMSARRWCDYCQRSRSKNVEKREFFDKIRAVTNVAVTRLAVTDFLHIIFRDFYNYIAADQDSWSLIWRRYHSLWRRRMT